MSMPDDAQLSDDGNYWWDGNEWQPVEANQGQGTAEGATGPDAVLAKVGGDASQLQTQFENAMDAAEGEVKDLEA